MRGSSATVRARRDDGHVTVAAARRSAAAARVPNMMEHWKRSPHQQQHGKRPGAPSDAPARAGQHARRDDDARRATRRRGGDDSTAAAAAAAAERAGEQRSNRQHLGLAAAPRDSDPCELASTLETQDASQDSADVSTCGPEGAVSFRRL